ncbi:CBS domain-containing protein [Dissulfurirhabdus thermomarina]|uniref:CBS domain-containing protein n=2 Tax=Dissulfurirhabdus thermomarina TaxID=1765737 RepID=A0A6N9TXS0_DISTH|nr:CBS domain-containing protein [Dissulfurirhabdus thermomarina]NMX24150.1 CBS domain-containing protein [Dissulfurirhabdus thermomarina]
MYVADHMTRDPVAVGPDLSIAEARSILASRDFRHLPVVEAGGRLVGVVTDRDLRSAYPSTVLPEDRRRAALAEVERTPVRRVMSPDPAVLSPLSTLDDALVLLDRLRVGALPVVEIGGRLVGILSIRDLIRAYGRLFGLGEKGGALVAVRDTGEADLLTRIVHVLEREGVSFTRLVRPGPEAGRGRVYVRVRTLNLRAVHAALAAAGLEVVTEGRPDVP